MLSLCSMQLSYYIIFSHNVKIGRYTALIAAICYKYDVVYRCNNYITIQSYL